MPSRYSQHLDIPQIYLNSTIHLYHSPHRIVPTYTRNSISNADKQHLSCTQNTLTAFGFHNLMNCRDILVDTQTKLIPICSTLLNNSTGQTPTDKRV